MSGKLAEPHIAGHATATISSTISRGSTLSPRMSPRRPPASNVKNASLARGNLRAQFQGSVGSGRVEGRATAVSGTASIANANLADLLAMVNQKDRAGGTVERRRPGLGNRGEPVIAADIHLVKGQIQDEPFDRLDAKVSSRGDTIEMTDGKLTAGARQITASATYQHPAGDFERGRVQFKVATNSMPLDQFRTVAKERPGVKGDGADERRWRSRVSQKAGKAAVEIADLRADVTAHGLALDEQMLGDAHFTANTQGQTLVTHVDSNFANSTIKGDGRWQLAGDYPGSTGIQFSNLDFTRLRDWLSPPKTPNNVQLAGSAQGKIMIEGPMMKPEQWKASLQIPQFQLQPAADALPTANRAALALKNAEPILVTMQNDVIRVASAHFTGSQTNITVGGTVSPKQRNQLDLQVSGKADLALLQNFDPRFHLVRPGRNRGHHPRHVSAAAGGGQTAVDPRQSELRRFSQRPFERQRSDCLQRDASQYPEPDGGKRRRQDRGDRLRGLWRRRVCLPRATGWHRSARALSGRREHGGECEPDAERLERGQPAGGDHHHPAHRLQPAHRPGLRAGEIERARARRPPPRPASWPTCSSTCRSRWRRT